MCVIYLFEKIGIARPNRRIISKIEVKIKKKINKPMHNYNIIMIEEKIRKKELIENIIQLGMINQLMYENTNCSIYDI